VPRVPGRPELPTRRERFDAVTLEAVADLDARFHDRLGMVEYAVEDVPQLPDDWDEAVPLASLSRGTGAEPSRIVVFRRPVEHRCQNHEELRDAVRGVLVERVAELLGLDPEDVDPDY
jgi:predicted Zn-dependent protease with MMP-like domain